MNRHFIEENSLQHHVSGTKFKGGVQEECGLGGGWKQRRGMALKGVTDMARNEASRLSVLNQTSLKVQVSFQSL